MPKAATAKKGDEEKKEDEKKISMGKGYFSLEEAPVNGSSVYTIVKPFTIILIILGFQKLDWQDSLSRLFVSSTLQEA